MKKETKAQERSCGFASRDVFGDVYWNDPRWKEVKKLRAKGKHPEANHLTFEIRNAWEVE